jgi:hypothetical protein
VKTREDFTIQLWSLSVDFFEPQSRKGRKEFGERKDKKVRVVLIK